MAGLINWVVKDARGKEVWWPSEELKRRAWVNDESIYEEAGKDPEAFWARLAKEGLHWYKGWDKVYEWTPPHFRWFVGGKINASHNAADRHMNTGRRYKAAIIWEPEPTDEPGRILTYHDLYREVNKFANVLKALGVKKGDRVGIYLPMIPELQIAMLACTRIGAVHSVVFSAFSAESLRTRLEDAEAKVLITADGYYRRGRLLNLKAEADKAVEGTGVKDVVAIKRAGLDVNMVEGRDHWWHELMRGADPYCEPEAMDSEDTMFILYTSGTTGRPKGVVHTTGGYLAQAYWTSKWDFDIHDDDIFWCTADIGWITGHTYSCYGPLMLGATMLVYEGAPDYPEPDRWWAILEKYGVTVLYTAPTAIRMFVKHGEKWPRKHDLTSLRILGTVGESIDREAWLWYFYNIGGGRCPIIDTWWQTETGGTLVNSLPGVGPFIPTVAGRSFPGTRHRVLDDAGREVGMKESGSLVQLGPFAPGMLRDIYGDPERYEELYFSRYRDRVCHVYDGHVRYRARVYYTYDRARVWDETYNIRLGGREDDVMKVAGHRLATAEVENALTEHEAVAEAAVVPAPHEIKGEVPVAFVIPKKGDPPDELAREITAKVVKKIGPTAKPERIIFTPNLPKTRSGKIMRRVLKALLANEPIGDTSTLLNPESIEELRRKVG